MKKLISLVLIGSFLLIPAFSADKYERVAGKAYSAVSPEKAQAEKGGEGLSTGAKIGIGAALLGGAIVLGSALLSDDKYEKIADKAYEATKKE